MTRLMPRVLALSATTLLALVAARAEAGQAVVETVYSPSPSILAVPTTYVLPTVYSSSRLLAPTYYVSPTSYLMPSYTETQYVVPRRFWRRPLVATTRVYDYGIVPASYYYSATVAQAPLLTSSAAFCCDPTPDCVTTAPAAGAAAPSNGAGNGNPDATAAGETPQLDPNALRLKSTPRNAAGAAAGKPTDTDPDVPKNPAPDDDKGLVVPAAGNPPADGQRHDVQRPAFANPRLGSARGVLKGRIMSAVDSKPEKGVKVVAADGRGRFVDKTAVSGNDGRFVVVLPEGDWTIRVPTKADGNSFFDQTVTVAGGLITDEKDQVVSSLTFNR